MKFTSAFGIIAIIASTTTAQDASDADVASVRQSLGNVVTAVQALDTQITGYTGAANTQNLEAAAAVVLTVLSEGTSVIAPLQGQITINQAAQSLLDQVDALNNIVAQTTQDVINQKSVFIAACLGPTILQTLNQQFSASTTFRDTIASKFSTDNQPLVDQVSQPALDSLTNAINNYSDQTSLPASCAPVSSSSAAIVSSSALAGSSSAVGASSAAGSSVSQAASTSRAASSGMTGVLPQTRSRTTTTTTVCPSPSPKPGCNGKCPAASGQSVGTTTTVCAGKCPAPSKTGGCNGAGCQQSTGPAKYTGAASHLVAGIDALAIVGAAMVMVL